MAAAEHWDTVYGTRSARDHSWFQERPDTSLRLISRFAAPPTSVVDVGAGESFLADGLLDAGWSDVTVLDVSQAAIAVVQHRLTGREAASFVVADLLQWRPERQYDVWHDRAVLHFLTQPDDQERYSAIAATAITTGGIAVLGTFAPDGATQCSGLPTCRYDAPTLSALFGGAFSLEHHEREEHRTPSGVVQPFTWVVLRRL